MIKILKISYFIISFVLLGCSTLNVNKLNKFTGKYYKTVQKYELRKHELEWGANSELIELMKEDYEYTIERRLSTRQRIIDSLQIPLNKLMIIDYLSHGTAGPFEVNYFIYDSTYISCSYSTSRTQREIFSSGNVKDLKERSSHEKMLYEIYDAFNINYPNIPKDFKREDDGKTSYSYEVTISKDNKVNFYKISNNENFVVYQLRGKKLLPL